MSLSSLTDDSRVVADQGRAFEDLEEQEAFRRTDVIAKWSSQAYFIRWIKTVEG